MCRSSAASLVGSLPESLEVLIVCDIRCAGACSCYILGRYCSYMMLRMLLEKSQEIMACALHIFPLICMARWRWGWWGHELIQVETVDLGQSCLGSVGLGSCFHVFPILCSMTSWRTHCLWLSVAGESWQPHRRTSWVRELSCSIVLYCTN